MARTIGGIVLALVLAIATVQAVEWLSHQVWPVPAGLDPADRGSLARYVEQLSLPSMLAVIVAWLLGPLVGGLVGNRVARRVLPGWLAAGLIVLGVVATVAMIPHPLWMIAAGIAAPLIGGWLAARFSPPRNVTSLEQPDLP